jgi:predicted DsbA family dithiol-disulfide isomerase
MRTATHTRVVDAVVWSDYLCPWCYVGLDRTRQLEDLGVRVTTMPYELHPDVPPEGWTSKEGRGRRLYERIAAECEEAGLPFARPARIPNTRRALATSEWVRVNAPHAHKTLHRSLFDALFVDGAPLDDPALLDALVDAAGADAAACRAAVEAGEMDAALEASREAAIDAGVTGTPSWFLDDRLLIPGLQAPEIYERMVTRLRERPRATG